MRRVQGVLTLRLIIIAMFSSALPAFAQASTAPARSRPNIIYIMADDLGYGELGCYGQSKIKTPNIDRLADQGARLTQFYSAAPVCAPSRASLMTGLHGGHAPIRDNREVGEWNSFRGQMPLPAASVTIAERLQEIGYATGCFGKWGLGEVGSTGDPLNQGFDRFFGYNCQRHAHNYYPRYLISDREQIELQGNDRGRTGAQYAPQLIADELLEFISDHREEPFFVYYASVIPHLALQVPDEELAPYLGKWPDPAYEGGKGYLPHDHPRAAYAAMVTFLDRQVGRIVATLDELGLADNTLIIFTSDNGPTHDRIGGSDSEFFNSSAGLRGLKGSVYEGGIRVPFVASWPGRIPPGTMHDEPFVAYDSFATLLDAAGDLTPPPTDGISFLPLLQGRDDQQHHKLLIWEFHGYGGQQAIRLGDWKGIRRDIRKGNLGIELYNLRDDGFEQRDVAAEHPDLVARIERLMAVERRISDHFPFPGVDEQTRGTGTD